MIGEMLWTGAWQGLALLGLVAIAVKTLKSVSPRRKSWLWWTCSLKFVLAPIVLVSPLVLPLIPNSQRPYRPVQVRVPTIGKPTAVYRPASAIVPTPLTSGDSKETPWAQFVAFLWVGGVLLGIFRIAFDQWRVACRVRRGKLMVYPPGLSRLNGLAPGRIPLMLLCDGLMGPMLVNPLRPTLLLPHDFEERFNTAERDLILAHELAHIEHRDLQLSLVPELACVLFFFLPPVWWAKSRWVTQRELLCDRRALETTGASPQTYGALLVRIVDRSDGQRQPIFLPAATFAATSSYGQLKMRLQELSVNRKTSSIISKMATCFLVVAALGALPWKIGAQPLDPQQKLASEKTKSLSHGKQVALLALLYTVDHNDKYPKANTSKEAFKLIEPYRTKAKYPPNEDIFTTFNPTPSRFLYNMALSGLSASAIPLPAETIMIYDEKPWPHDMHLVGFADGHVKLVTPQVWSKISKTLKPGFWKNN